MRVQQRCVSLERRTQGVASTAGFVDEFVDKVEKAIILVGALRKLAVEVVRLGAILWLVTLGFGDPSSLHETVEQARRLTALFGSFV